jgi:ketosteroid isomerase-like protein
MTLTFSHQKGEPLAGLIKAAKAAKTHFTNSRVWKSLKKRGLLVGTITATELTHGANGWHPHFHVLIFLRPNDLTTWKDLTGHDLRDQWLASLEASGRSGGDSAFDLQNGSAAGSYVSKWGAAEELTLGSKKGGKGRNPFAILEDASNGDAQSSELFREYARAFKGVRQLFWTNGLKTLLSVSETSDEEAADLPQENEEALVITMTAFRWKERGRNKRARLLDVSDNTPDLFDASQAIEREIYDEAHSRVANHRTSSSPRKEPENGQE